MSKDDTPAETPKKKTIGDVAQAAIRDGANNEAALKAVKVEFPEAKTSLASINWYRNKLRNDGEPVKTARELNKISKAAAANTESDDKGAGSGDPLD